MPGHCVSLLQLPEELLLAVFERLPKAQLLMTLPLVCKAFARLMRLPSSCWAEANFHSMFDTLTLSIEAAVFCRWLQPRAASLDTFTFPVDAFLLRDNVCFAQQLIAVLPESLTTLKLQTFVTDAKYGVYRQETSHLETFSHLQQGFQLLQDTAPHLASLTRLSKLQELSLPLHVPMDKQDLESLSALKSLHNLHLEWRDE